MKEIILELEPKLSFEEFKLMLKEDAKYYYNTNDNIVDAFDTTINDKINPKITEIFYNDPPGAPEIKPDSDEESAWYTAGTFDGKRPSVLKVATSDKRRCLFE